MCLILLKVEQSAFTHTSFSSLSDIHEYSVGLQMSPSSLGKQAADCNLPYDWLMSMAMDLAASSDMYWGNGTNGCHLAGFSVNVAFACHFVAPHPPTL